MPRRIVPLALAALVLALGSACAAEVSPAARVGDAKISDADLMTEVGEWAHNEAAFDPAELERLNPGTYPMRLVNVILQQRIDLELHQQEFDALGLELTEDLRSQAVLSLFQGDTALAEQALGGFSRDYADRYIDAIGRQFGVEQELGQQGYVAWRSAAYEGANIEVSARYGRWDPQAQAIVGPDGPRSAAPDLFEP